MQIRSKKSLWLAIALIVVGAIGWLALGGKSTGAAEKYKAELRGKGEKIAFAELGFPRPPADGSSLMQLTNAVSRLRRRGDDAWKFTSPNATGPGRQRVVWRGDNFPLDQATNFLSWTEVGAILSSVTNELAEIRGAVEQPPRWFQYDPAGYVTNFAGIIRYPFVEMRAAAQWLYTDGIAALHAGDLARARQDHHALIQLAEFNQEDPTLVAAMIQVAIAGLNLQFTWQVLQSEGWTETDLAAMQQDWERVDLLKSVETGFTGERAFTEMAFTATREHGLGWMRQSMTQTGPPRPFEKIRDAFVGMLWNADEDELLALRHHQETLETIRALQTGRAWPEVDAAIKRQHQVLMKALDSSKGINHFRFQLSAIAIPNSSKAVQTAARHEAQRRLTVAAIALKRYQLNHQRLPEKLDELVPEFLAAVPVDLMDAKPLRYRREGETDFVLYSVGEDGKDDGGNVTPVIKTANYEIWSGLDSVWPKPAD